MFTKSGSSSLLFISRYRKLSFAAVLLVFLFPLARFAGSEELKEAMFYEKLQGGRVLCELCPRQCVIADGRRGFCRVRENKGGTLYTLVYGKPCSINVGPIEKAPLFHFIPGHRRLCLATAGCNLKCKFCQNWQISQASPGELQEHSLSPADIIREAKRTGVTSICFTYSEPTIFYEYVYETSLLAKKEGIKTSIVSNGYINPEPLKKLIKVLDAVKIDLKAFTDKFYKEIAVEAELEPVLNTLKILKEEGAYFEIVNLIIPTLNDSHSEIKAMCEWIKNNLGENIPVHFSRFTPSYKLTNLPATPVETLDMAIKTAKEAGLKFVYIGNVPGHENNSTFCPNCGKMLIHRVHFSVLRNDIKNGNCGFCGHKIPGVWQ